jgi:hypothetical protein
MPQTTATDVLPTSKGKFQREIASTHTRPIPPRQEHTSTHAGGLARLSGGILRYDAGRVLGPETQHRDAGQHHHDDDADGTGS